MVTKVKKLPPKLSTEQITAIVDGLGETKAKIAKLEKDEKKSVDTLKLQGVKVYCGELFEANVFEQERNKVVDYAALAIAAEIPQKLIKQHTKTEIIPEQRVSTIDWEAVLKAAELDEEELAELLEKHTTSDKVMVCKVTARS